MRRQSLLVCLLAGMLVAIVAAQDGQRLEFEVATVKPLDRSAPVIIETIVYPGGRLVIRAASLATLVSSARPAKENLMMSRLRYGFPSRRMGM